MRHSDPFKPPHSPRSSWERRIAEREPFLAKVRAWRDAAVADGWTSRPTYQHEAEEAAFTLDREGFKVMGLARPAGKLLPEASLAMWGPDGLAVEPPEIYDWSAIKKAGETCIYCGAYPVKRQRVAFAGAACATCAPIEWAKVPRGWCN